MNYRLTGGTVFDPDCVFRKADVYIRDGRIVEKAPDVDFEDIDISGLKLIPGLTDIHFHGCKGLDFCEGDASVIRIMADYEESRGITQICPATMTFPEEKLLKVMEAAKNYRGEGGASLVGINMEGPFISYEKRGAQNPDFIMKPDAGMFRRLQEASGNLIKLVALAPETEGSEGFIEELKDEIIISFAHSAADYDKARKAFEGGVRHMTHIHNAMAAMGHRDPGPVFAAADTEYVEAEMICDGIHIHPAAVRATFKLFGDDRIIFISDSMEAVGMPDGEYELGGIPVIKKGIRAAQKNGTIAGSAANLMDCVRTAVLEMDIPLETAVKCASVNPARSIGIYDRFGSIETGKEAALVALNDDLEVCLVINRGRIAYTLSVH